MVNFEPDATAAHADHDEMQQDLLASLRKIADHLSDTAPELVTDLSAFREALRSPLRLPTSVFGLYYDLVETIDEDSADASVRKFRALLKTRPAGPKLKIDSLFGDIPHDHSERILRYMSAPETGAASIAAPAPRWVRPFRRQLEAALQLIDTDLPEFSAELRALVSQIVLVGPGNLRGGTFEGGTCFRLWGTLALNAHRRASALDLAISLVHEAGHARLFGLCRREMLVENPDCERHWSPIRKEDRPVEGIFHAAFVSARMIWAMDRLLARSSRNHRECAKLRHDLAAAEHVYSGSVDMLRAHARFTSTGAEIFDAMDAFMSHREMSCVHSACL